MPNMINSLMIFKKVDLVNAGKMNIIDKFDFIGIDNYLEKTWFLSSYHLTHILQITPFTDHYFQDQITDLNNLFFF